ncbi:GPI ethanolamine phosphate transferase 1 [Drosophila novamexicana]|uniref:GPI ethanolamine phosphate transferase 1 n=1 Tax=Drosophila novamexicana TaxID=47314 RepID=UPI0011E5EED1|nr:GPI ethanolamine phosphate transferase 1 [Drosophila novamexicana]
MWKLLALLVHILLLGFLTLIYYKTSIINGMRPQAGHRELGLEPPADRLVVFLVDGLRAESLFRNNLSAVPQLKNMFLERGLMGISRGSAPTETRPGHIAIFGGFDEDAASAMTNFKSNPTVFDTVLNRTAGATWAWGAKSVLQFFKLLPDGGVPINLDMHTPLDFTESYQRHQWIYDKVRKLLDNLDSEAAGNKLPAVFLVDFENVHSVGNESKINSKEFLKAIDNAETVAKLYDLFEHIFEDSRTVYLLTSDHGMTDKGTHSGDSQFDIETPFVFWGAGIKRVESPIRGVQSINSDAFPMQLQKVQQTQLAPLMSALIGLPPPMNNRAMLPLGLMNVSVKYEAYSMHLNTMQVLAQAERVLELKQRSQIYNWLPRFERLDRRRIQQYKEQFHRQMQLGCGNDAMLCSQEMIHLALECIEYHRVYYRIPVVVACLATYLGWFYYLLAKQTRSMSAPKQHWLNATNIMLLLLEIVVLLACYLDRVPCCISFYLLVPLPVWMFALQERGMNSGCVRAPIIQLAWIGGTVVLLIATYFFKQLISLGFLIVVCANNGRAFTRAPRLRFWLWLALVALLTGFTVKRPDFGHNSPYLLCLSMLVTMLRPLLLSERHACRVWLINGAALLLGAYLVHQRLCKKELAPVLQGTAWGYVFYALISIPYSDTKTPRHRVQLILFNLSTIYTLMSLSYESMFMQLLCTEFLLGVQVHEDYKQSAVEDSEDDDEQTPDKSLTPEGHINRSYRYAVLILIYAYFSMIGTGVLPNINSLDASVARIFVSECSIILIGFIYVLKLMIPIIIIMSSMYAFCAHARQNLCGIFICIFLICDVLCLYFFFFVRNSGSWRNVRESLSQQLIVHGLPMLLAIFSWLPKQLLSAIPLTMLPMLRWKSAIHLEQPGQSQA